ncbi:MAG: O-antigen ligase family protein [bacterium]|nr:O-antigen ligase family protein [bacterium]
MNNIFNQNYNSHKKLILFILSFISILAIAFLAFFPMTFLLVVAILAVLLFFAIKPEIGLYLMVFFLPVIHLVFNYKSLEIPLIDLIGLIVGVSFFIRVIYFYFFDNKVFNISEKIKWPYLFAFLLFFSATIISSLLSDNIISSLWYSLRWILFFYLIYLVLPFNIIKNEKILKNAIIVFVISGLSIAVLSFISLYFQDWQNEFVRVKPFGWNNIYPLGQNQNLLAEIWLGTIFFIIALKYWFNSVFFKKIVNIIVIFLVLMLLGTFSRAAWLILLAQLFIYFLYKRKLIIKKNITLAVLILVILFPLFIYMSKMQSQYNIGQSSTENRQLLAQISLQAFINKPIFGWGSGEFINLVANNVRFRAKFGEPMDSHGIWQKVLAENGLVGVITFAIFSFCIFKDFFISIKKYREKINLLLPLIIGCFGVFLFEFFNTSYYAGKLWLVVALVMASIKIISKNKIYDK